MAAPAKVLASANIIKLNVGGWKYATTKDTLLRSGNSSFFASLLEGKFGLTVDEDGCVFIDRDGRTFEIILNFLRTAHLNIPDNSASARKAVLMEADFYGLDEIVKLIKMQDSDDCGGLYFDSIITNHSVTPDSPPGSSIHNTNNNNNNNNNNSSNNNNVPIRVIELRSASNQLLGLCEDGYIKCWVWSRDCGWVLDWVSSHPININQNPDADHSINQIDPVTYMNNNYRTHIAFFSFGTQRWFVSAFSDRTITLWKKTGKFGEIPMFDDHIDSMFFAKSGQYCVTITNRATHHNTSNSNPSTLHLNNTNNNVNNNNANNDDDNEREVQTSAMDQNGNIVIISAASLSRRTITSPSDVTCSCVDQSNDYGYCCCGKVVYQLMIGHSAHTLLQALYSDPNNEDITCIRCTSPNTLLYGTAGGSIRKLIGSGKDWNCVLYVKAHTHTVADIDPYLIGNETVVSICQSDHVRCWTNQNNPKRVKLPNNSYKFPRVGSFFDFPFIYQLRHDRVKIIEAITGNQLYTIHPINSSPLVTCCKLYMVNGDRVLVTSHADGSLQFWNLKALQQNLLLKFVEQ